MELTADDLEYTHERRPELQGAPYYFKAVVKKGSPFYEACKKSSYGLVSEGRSEKELLGRAVLALRRISKKNGRLEI